MQTSAVFSLCSHVKRNGKRCGSPAMRGGKLCFFHDPAARWRHKQAQLALRPNPSRLALHNLVRAWPSHPVGGIRRRLLDYAFSIAANLAEEMEAGSSGTTQKCQSSSGKTVI